MTSSVLYRITALIFLMVSSCALGQSLALTPEVQSHLAAAQQAQAAQDYSTAEKEYLTVIKLAPKFAEVRMNLGLIRQLQGRQSEAMDDFRAALKLKPNLTGANFLLGVNYCKLGDGASAIPYLKAAIAEKPDQVEFLSWLANAQDIVGQYPAEIATLHRALNLEPRNVDLLYLLGQAYERLGKQQAAELKKSAPDSARAEQLVAESYTSTNEWPSAVIHFENAIAKAPNLPGLHVELGEVYLHAGKLKQGGLEFDKELQSNPHSLRALVRRGEVHLLQEEIDNALSDFDKALSIDSKQTRQVLGMQETGFGDATNEQLAPSVRARLDRVSQELNSYNSASARLALAFISIQSEKPSSQGDVAPPKPASCSVAGISQLLAEQRYSQLKPCLHEIIKPEFAATKRLEAASGLLAVGEYQSALEVLESLSSAEKRSPDGSYLRARCYEKLATAAYLSLFQVDPDSFRVHQLLGDLAATRNDDAKAIEEYRAAVNLNSTAPNLHYNLGHILWKDLRISEARVELEAELKISPRHSGALHDLGDTYLQEHQPEKGLPYLERAKAADPSNADIHRDLGTAYAQLKQFAQAAAEYKIAVSDDQDGSTHYKLAKVYQSLGEKENADQEFAIYTAMNQRIHDRLEKRGQRLADIERTLE